MEWKMDQATWKDGFFQDEWWRPTTWSALHSQDKIQEPLGDSAH